MRGPSSLSFLISWLILFPLACGLGICSIEYTRGPLGGGNGSIRVWLANSELLCAATALFLITSYVSQRYFRTMVFEMRSRAEKLWLKRSATYYNALQVETAICAAPRGIGHYDD
jgi:hypothetical protein